MPEAMITRDAVLAALARHIGADRGVTARELVAEIAGVFARPGDERRLRHVIEALRREGEHVCGTTEEGYYLARTAEELDRTCLFLTAGRFAYPAPPGTGPVGMRCHDCKHYRRVNGGNRDYPKCELNRARWTHGRGTDINSRSQACRKFEAPPT